MDEQVEQHEQTDDPNAPAVDGAEPYTDGYVVEPEPVDGDGTEPEPDDEYIDLGALEDAAPVEYVPTAARPPEPAPSPFPLPSAALLEKVPELEREIRHFTNAESEARAKLEEKENIFSLHESDFNRSTLVEAWEGLTLATARLRGSERRLAALRQLIEQTDLEALDEQVRLARDAGRALRATHPELMTELQEMGRRLHEIVASLYALNVENSEIVFAARGMVDRALGIGRGVAYVPIDIDIGNARSEVSRALAKGIDRAHEQSEGRGESAVRVRQWLLQAR